MHKLTSPPPFAGTVTLTDKAGVTFDISVMWRYYGDRTLRTAFRPPSTDEQCLALLIESWQGVADANGDAIAPDEQGLAFLLDMTTEAAATQLLEAYKRARDEAAKGN